MEDDQQHNLRWSNHQNTLISHFAKLLENGTLVDCTLTAEGQFLKAHKVVLSACSTYFANLLKETFDKHPIFILKDVKIQELRAMMDYMYRGEVNIPLDQLDALLEAAESLQIIGLSDRPQRSTEEHQNIPGRMQHPHGGYTLEQAKRPHLGPVNDTPDMRGGSSSRTSRNKKKLRTEQDNQMKQEKQNKKVQNKKPIEDLMDEEDLNNQAGPSHLGGEGCSQDLTEDTEELSDEVDLYNQTGPSHLGGEGCSQDLTEDTEELSDEVDLYNQTGPSHLDGEGCIIVSLEELKELEIAEIAELNRPRPSIFADISNYKMTFDTEPYDIEVKQEQQQQHPTTTTTTTNVEKSEKQLYICQNCGKPYRWKSTLRRHIRFQCIQKK